MTFNRLHKHPCRKQRDLLFFIFVFIFFSLFLSSCNCRSELEGSWVGCQVRRPLIEWLFTVETNQFFLVREDSGLWYRGLIRLNLNCRLKKIDMIIHDTSIPALKGKTALGIFEIDGDTLTIASSEPGGQFRPRSFDEPGTTEFIFAKD
jgi:uncharacterized protein (TIGR03067 family)